MILLKLYRIWADDGEYEIIDAKTIEDAKRIFKEKTGRRATVAMSVDKQDDKSVK
jgi:hypothetical protein